MAIALTYTQDYLLKLNFDKFKTLKQISRIFKAVVSVFLIFIIFFVMNDTFYKWTHSSKVFGVSVPNGLERAVGFVKDNKIEGPMFNNFDIGGYLIWKLFPQEKVFVDNRPEAYSVKFFKEIYKPMQENKEKWTEFSEKYGINFIFFSHADATPWGSTFLRNIIKNSDWKTVYVNEDVVVLTKNNKKNAEIISKFSVTEKNAIDKVSDYTKNSNKDIVSLNLVLSHLLYNISWREASIYFADKTIKFDPKNSQAHLYKGLDYAYYTDEKSQKLAAENIKKAIDLGLKDSQYYSILGVVYMNLGRLESAKEYFKEAIRIDKNNSQAQEFLNKYFK
jgi:tetratricopeptide (TPR) repeat protein